MASKTVIDAVALRLGETWSEIPVRMPNIGGPAPRDGSAFIAVDFPVANSERVAVNQRLYREEGGFRIILNGGADTGIDQIMTWSDQLAALFRDQKFGGIETQVPSSPFVDDSNDDGNYFQASVVVPYTYNFTG
jgi:hypothetical protein